MRKTAGGDASGAGVSPGTRELCRRLRRFSTAASRVRKRVYPLPRATNLTRLSLWPWLASNVKGSPAGETGSRLAPDSAQATVVHTAANIMHPMPTAARWHRYFTQEFRIHPSQDIE